MPLSTMCNLFSNFLRIGSFLLFTGYCLLVAQPEVGMVSPLVGPTIEQDEYERFKLDEVLEWPVAAIDSLRIIPTGGEEQFLLFAYFTDNTEQGIPIGREDLKEIRDKITLEGSSMLRIWRVQSELLEAGRSPRMRITTYEGTQFTGILTDLAPYLITLTLENSLTQVLRLEDIAQWEPERNTDYNSVRDQNQDTWSPPDTLDLDNTWEPWPLYMRYTFLPNAIPTEKGDRYIGLTRVTFHGAINDHLSLTISPGLGSALFSGALPGLFLLSGSTYIKYSYQLKPKLHIAAGGYFAGFFATTPGTNVGAVAGWVNGMATYGTRDQNITLGAGWFGFQGLSSLRTNLLLQERPLVYAGGVKRLGPRIALTGEALWWSSATTTLTGADRNQVGILSMGTRFFVYQLVFHAGVAYGIVAERNSGSAPWRVRGLLAPFNYPIPYVDLMLYLGNKSR